jgi:hypothetical protein
MRKERPFIDFHILSIGMLQKQSQKVTGAPTADPTMIQVIIETYRKLLFSLVRSFTLRTLNGNILASR